MAITPFLTSLGNRIDDVSAWRPQIPINPTYLKRIAAIAMPALLVFGGVYTAICYIRNRTIRMQPYQPTVENLQAREWFQNSKFGLFIHWGPYSVLENGEWVLERTKLNLQQYETLATSHFNPTRFDPAAWVSLAKAAGMKYITITSKHHDGFAMWGTQQNKWNIVNGAPYAKDPLKMLADECKKQGLKLFFYYSQLDWHNPDYFPLGKTGHLSGRALKGDFNKYLDHMDAQLTELLTGYGGIGGIWFDGMWDKPKADWRIAKTYALIHQLQPAALVGSNHHLAPFEGEDLQMFEKDLPGKCTQDWGVGAAPISALPLEVCETINDSWGYDCTDQKFKSTKDLIHYLVTAAGNNSNLLLNVGPSRDGTVQPEFVERLQGVGSWLEKNGDSIYGTRGGPLAPMPWGVTTQKGNKIYLHILKYEGVISIPLIENIAQAGLFPSGAPIAFEKEGSNLVLRLSEDKIDEIDTIIELKLNRNQLDAF